MSVEIIYEKKYPRIDPMEEMKQIELEMADEPEEPTPSFEEIMQKIQENTTYVLMSERIKASEDFIRAAIEVSELYELDTKIERHFDHISVDYSCNCCGGLRDINRVIGMADQSSFFKDIFGWDITISLDFFTHAVVRNGRVVAP
nr:MAG TPA: hypothetical protein [Caudoviricetes sp.]